MRFIQRFLNSINPLFLNTILTCRHYYISLKPFRRGCWFVKDKDYNAYNTIACVGNLKKSMQEGDMMTDAEILALQQNTQDSNMDGVVNPSRRWLRKRKAAK